MEWLILFIVLIALVFLTLRRNKSRTEDSSYEIKRQLFTPAERSFYGVLNQAVRDDAVVFGKVRVADVLSPSKGLGRSAWQRAFNRISAKHFDYVICSPDTLSVLSVIELDDKSHSQGQRFERDRLINDACAAARLTLHRFNARATYNIQEIREAVFPPIFDAENQGKADTNEKEPPEEEKQLCPRCSAPLVLRVAEKGKHKGKEFLGCSEFPKCRYTEQSNA